MHVGFLLLSAAGVEATAVAPRLPAASTGVLAEGAAKCGGLANTVGCVPQQLSTTSSRVSQPQTGHPPVVCTAGSPTGCVSFPTPNFKYLNASATYDLDYLAQDLTFTKTSASDSDNAVAANGLSITSAGGIPNHHAWGDIDKWDIPCDRTPRPPCPP